MGLIKKIVKPLMKGAIDFTADITPFTALKSTFRQLGEWNDIKPRDINGNGKIDRWEIGVQLIGKLLALIAIVLILISEL